jgi:hypothetical protein
MPQEIREAKSSSQNPGDGAHGDVPSDRIIGDPTIEFEAVCQQIFKAPHVPQTFDVDGFERILYGEKEGDRRLIQSSVETGSVYRIGFRFANGKLVHEKSSDNYGTQAYMDPLVGGFLKEFDPGWLHNYFGVIPFLVNRLSSDTPASINQAITAFGKTANSTILHDTIQACKFSSAEEETYGEMSDHTILNFDLDDLDCPRVSISAPKIITTIQNLNTSVHNERFNDIPWFTDLRQALDAIMQSSWYLDLGKLIADHPEDLSANRSLVKNPEVKKQLVGIFKTNQKTVEAFGEVVNELAVLTTLAREHEQLPTLIGSAGGYVTESTEIAIHNARHRTAVYMCANRVGQKIQNPYWADDKEMMQRGLDVDKSHHSLGDIIKAAAPEIQSQELPISLEITHDRPIIVITGRNGDGKTRGIETVASQILWGQLTGLSDGAESVALQATEPPSTLINTATTSSDISTFEGEMYPLVRAITESITGKPRITFVDEIGRGTDSRDALAIALAAARHTIQTNSFLVISTHYGHDMVELAKKLGMRQKMRIFNVDPTTHALVEVNDPTDSKGVEVWHKRAKTLDKPIKDILFQQAVALRTAVTTGQLLDLPSWNLPEAESQQKIRFVDQDTLNDLCMGTEPGSRDVYDGLLTLVPGTSIGLTEMFNRHLELASTFDPAILTQDKQLINGLFEVGKKRGVAMNEIIKHIASVSSMIGTWTNISVSKDDTQKITDFVKKNDKWQFGQRLSFYGSEKVLDSFLSAFGSLSQLRRQISGNDSAFSQLGNIFMWNEKLKPLMDQLYPESLLRIYANAFISAQQTEIESMRKSFSITMHDAIENESSWSQSHVEKTSEHFGIPKDTQWYSLGRTIAKLWNSQDPDTRRDVFTWILAEYEQEKQSSGPFHSIIRNSPLRAIFELADIAVKNYDEVKNENPRGFPEDASKWKSYVIEKLIQNDLEPIFALSRAIRMSKGMNLGGSETRDFQRYMYSLDHLILVEFQQALTKQRNEPQGDNLSVNSYLSLVDTLGYVGVFANAIESFKWSIPTQSTDGSYIVEDAIPLDILSKKKIQDTVRQTFSISPNTNMVTINGYNGNGKTVLLRLMGIIPLMSELSGYVPAKNAVIPQYGFIRTMINAGKSTQEASSFQNEADRSIHFVNDFIAAGRPQNGLILLDEPNASTSGGDQIGVTLSVAGLLTSSNNLVAMTNHNSQMYSVMRMINGRIPMNFQVLAYPYDPNSPYKLLNVPSDQAESVQSGGIDKAASMGLDPAVVEIAKFIRSVTT